MKRKLLKKHSSTIWGTQFMINIHHKCVVISYVKFVDASIAFPLSMTHF